MNQPVDRIADVVVGSIAGASIAVIVFAVGEACWWIANKWRRR